MHKSRLLVAVSLAAAVCTFLAATIVLIAFAIDIALFANLRHQTDKLGGANPYAKPGPGVCSSSLPSS